MTIQQLEGDKTLIGLAGRLDIEGAQAIDDPFAYATTTRPRRIVVDLDQVSFIASIGVRTLLSAARAQSARGGRIVLARPSPMVLRVLQTAGVDQLMPVCGSIESATAALDAA